MTATNHAAAGAIIALAVHRPLLVIPLAFLSHFAMDALPHYGYDRAGYGEALKHRLTYLYILLAWIGLGVFIWAIWGQNWLVFLAAIVAVSPDFMWPYRYFFFEKKGLKPPGGQITKFHQWIQWCEYPWGLVVETLITVGAIGVILKLK